MLTKSQKDEMLAKYAASLSGDRSRAQLVSICREFLEQMKYREPNRAAVVFYMKYLRETRGFSDASINLKWRTLRRFFIVNGLEWPFTRNEVPRVRESDVYAPALHPEIIKKFIGLAHAGELTRAEAALLALSTTYGHRRAELASTEKEDVDTSHGMLLVKTLKHGRERWHLLRDELAPWVEGYDFPKLTEDKVTRVYLSIEAKAGMQHIEATGWHSIRRTLVTLIGHYCSELEVHKFFRWGATSMEQRYTAVTFVGMEEIDRELNLPESQVDEKVFAQHPFLKLWGGDSNAAPDA
jgi:integrase